MGYMFSPTGEGCGCCEQSGPCACTNCDGEKSCCMQVEFSGLKGGGCYCPHCPELNRAYRVPTSSQCQWAGWLTPAPAKWCTHAGQWWFEQYPAPTGLFTHVFKRGDNYIVAAHLTQHRFFGAPFNILTWEKNYGTTKPDCGSFAGESLPFKTDYGNKPQNSCDGSGSVALLTALPTSVVGDCETTAPLGQPPGCTACTWGKTPATWEVTIPANWTSVDPACTTCNSFSGTFLLNYRELCTWSYSTGAHPGNCGWSSVSLSLTRPAFAMTPVRLNVTIGGEGSEGPDDDVTPRAAVGFALDLPPLCDAADCLPAGSTTVPFLSASYGGQACRWGGASITVRAIP